LCVCVSVCERERGKDLFEHFSHKRSEGKGFLSIRIEQGFSTIVDYVPGLLSLKFLHLILDCRSRQIYYLLTHMQRNAFLNLRTSVFERDCSKPWSRWNY